MSPVSEPHSPPSRRRSQVAKAADCKSAIAGSNPAGASRPQTSFYRGLRPFLIGCRLLWATPWAFPHACRRQNLSERFRKPTLVCEHPAPLPSGPLTQSRSSSPIRVEVGLGGYLSRLIAPPPNDPRHSGYFSVALAPSRNVFP